MIVSYAVGIYQVRAARVDAYRIVRTWMLAGRRNWVGGAPKNGTSRSAPRAHGIAQAPAATRPAVLYSIAASTADLELEPVTEKIVGDGKCLSRGAGDVSPTSGAPGCARRPPPR